MFAFVPKALFDVLVPPGWCQACLLQRGSHRCSLTVLLVSGSPSIILSGPCPGCSVYVWYCLPCEWPSPSMRLA